MVTQPLQLYVCVLLLGCHGYSMGKSFSLEAEGFISVPDKRGASVQKPEKVYHLTR